MGNLISFEIRLLLGIVLLFKKHTFNNYWGVWKYLCIIMFLGRQNVCLLTNSGVYENILSEMVSALHCCRIDTA